MRSALCSWLSTSETTPFGLYPPFSCKAYPGTRTYHERVGSERPAERPGEVGQDWVPTELFAQKTKVYRSLQGIEETTLLRFPEARTSEILCKPTEERNHRLTRGLSPVDPRFISEVRSALCSWLPTSGTTPFFVGNPFHARHIRENFCSQRDLRDAILLSRLRVSLAK